MSVRVQLDQPDGYTYTNLDFVTGRAILILPSDATISSITVKLEAESRTVLVGPKSPHNEDKKKTELELHKLLYKVETVFPGPELRERSRNSQFTLLRGQYEYPFRFKFPFNTDCTNNTSLMKDLKVGAVSVQFVQEPRHMKRALPPSLGGFPGEAEIKYFVKATVVRPKFYQENLRATYGIKFLPLEPPRPPDRREETFARRKHQFQAVPLPAKRKTSLFRKNSLVASEEEPLSFQIDARLPNPPIITCNEPLPLRVFVEKLNGSTASVFLSMLQIELIGHTHVRAHDLDRTESGTWLLTSQANMNIPLDYPIDKAQKPWTVPSRFWDQIPLPKTVAPSFETCNITRKYELEIRVGLAHGMADGVRPELIVSPLRLDVQILSGIRPPPQLLNAMQSLSNSVDRPQRVNTDSEVQAAGPSRLNAPSQSTTPVSPKAEYSGPPAQAGTLTDSTTIPATLFEDPDDLPPSYEDAMAEDIAPVDGPRREYAVADGNEDGQSSGTNSPGLAFNPDSKSPAGPGGSGGGGLGRMPSERLFSQNAPRPPGSGPGNSFRRNFSSPEQSLPQVQVQPDSRYQSQFHSPGPSNEKAIYEKGEGGLLPLQTNMQSQSETPMPTSPAPPTPRSPVVKRRDSAPTSPLFRPQSQQSHQFNQQQQYHDAISESHEPPPPPLPERPLPERKSTAGAILARFTQSSSKEKK